MKKLICLIKDHSVDIKHNSFGNYGYTIKFCNRCGKAIETRKEYKPINQEQRFLRALQTTKH